MNQITEWIRESLLQSQLFMPLHQVIAQLKEHEFPSLHDCNILLETHRPSVTVQSGVKIKFVAQESGKLAFETQYEPRCYLKGEVQTRENNWHDLFNALVWLTFPKAKAALNLRHYQVLTELKMDQGSQRGAVRDMVTLFDESGVIVVCADEELESLLRDFKWKELFWQRRQLVQEKLGVYLFGHGLYEKAMHPYIGLTGQGLLCAVKQEFFDLPQAEKLEYLDQQAAEYLMVPEHCQSTRELTPIPLLGVPGWDEDNRCESYYDNTHYFRSGRVGKKSVL